MSDNHIYSVSAGAAIQDEAGRFLAIRRRDNGRWELPGGIVEPGERLEDALVREVVEETGYLVRHGDIDALAATMKKLAGDRALVGQLGEQGRRFAQSFTWERAASETTRHLDEVMGTPRLGGGG